MSRENVELRAIAEAAYGALNVGDRDALLALVAEDVEFTSMVAEAEATTFRGHAGVREWWETVRGAFEDVRWTLLGFSTHGDGGVAKIQMAATLGGLRLEQTMWQAAAVQGGQLKWWAFFRSEREALAAIAPLEQR